MGSDEGELARYVQQVAARATGDESYVGPMAPSSSDELERHVAQAEQFAVVGAELPEGTRLKGVKDWLLRLLTIITRDQSAHNVGAVSALRTLARQRITTDQQLARIEGRVASIDRALERLGDDSEQRRQGTEQRVSDQLRAELGASTADFQSRFAEVEGLLRGLVEPPPGEDEQADTEEGDDEQGLRTVLDRLVEFEDELTAQRRSVIDAVERAAQARTEALTTRGRVDMFLKEARKRLPDEPFDKDELSAFADALDRRFDSLYADFELTFRGHPDEIREKLAVYLPDILALPGDGRVVDVGSGRGEWLDVLADAGIPAYGVDINDTFVTACRERGHEMVAGDALAHLYGLPESSVKAVTAHHIIEHLDFEVLLEFIDACLHAVRPGGAIIFETPNPTNLIVGAASFYTDPTHKKPLHPQLLEFVLNSRGFTDVEVRYLHPRTEVPVSIPEFTGLEGETLTTLLADMQWALHGPMDYAVLGYKSPGRPDPS